MSTVQNVLRILYAQNFVFGVLALFFQDELLKAYAFKGADASTKNAMTWWGIAMLTGGLIGAAVAQCGDVACRKVLQYSMVQTMIQMVLAVKVVEAKNIQVIIHFGANLIITLYACYACTYNKKAKTETVSSGTCQNVIRFLYITLAIIGLASTLFQDRLMKAIPEGKIYDGRVVYFWGAANLGAACMLMAVAQLGYSCQKKVLQYTMCAGFAALWFTHKAAYLHETSKRNIMVHQGLNVALALVACYVIAPCKIDAKQA